MSKPKPENKSKQPMQQGLLMAMSSLDRQVARDITQRSTPEQEVHGVGRTSAINSRVELVTSFIIDEFSEANVELDSLLILSRAMTKALAMVSSELGEETMGKIRTACCLEALKQIIEDAEDAKATLEGHQFVN